MAQSSRALCSRFVDLQSKKITAFFLVNEKHGRSSGIQLFAKDGSAPNLFFICYLAHLPQVR